MNTGKLNRRISYTPFGTYTETALGGSVLSVAGTSVETWCSARQLSMRELISYGLPVDYKTFEFGFIYERGANIVNGMTLTYESKQYRVIQVAEKDEAKREIKVIANNQ